MQPELFHELPRIVHPDAEAGPSRCDAGENETGRTREHVEGKNGMRDSAFNIEEEHHNKQSENKEYNHIGRAPSDIRTLVPCDVEEDQSSYSSERSEKVEALIGCTVHFFRRSTR